MIYTTLNTTMVTRLIAQVRDIKVYPGLPSKIGHLGTQVLFVWWMQDLTLEVFAQIFIEEKGETQWLEDQPGYTAHYAYIDKILVLPYIRKALF